MHLPKDMCLFSVRKCVQIMDKTMKTLVDIFVNHSQLLTLGGIHRVQGILDLEEVLTSKCREQMRSVYGAQNCKEVPCTAS